MKHKEKETYITLIDVLYILGAVLISVGVGMAFGLSWGLIATGVFCIAGSVLVEVPAGEDGDDFT